MKNFKFVRSIITPLDKINVDTDQIVPKQFLKLVTKTGFGKYLFYNWRFNLHGDKKPNFVLNKSLYRNSKILVSRDNFGCGSSREHAPIALSFSGIKIILALSFARIFYRNAIDGAFIIPVEIDQNTYDGINDGDELNIDIQNNKIKNLTTSKTYSTKPFSYLIKKIIDAGGIFKLDM
jgi:3-isopropylmalate/(R)-2-methylmalate dehydratase small subunit